LGGVAHLPGDGRGVALFIDYELRHHRTLDICYKVRQEHLFDIEGMYNCVRDEGRPLGAGLQEQTPNHLKLRWLRASVVSVKEMS